MIKVNLEELRLGVSELTEEVQIGIPDKKNKLLWKHKKEIHNDFLHAVITLWKGKGVIVTKGNLEYEITVKVTKLKDKGFMVSYEKRDGDVLTSGKFPNKVKGEKLIKTEEEAWALATKFAQEHDDTFVNIYVTDHTYSPVKGYAKKKIRPY